ncbi:MAG: DNA polymerase III subunit delta [Bacilli bacterium]
MVYIVFGAQQIMVKKQISKIVDDYKKEKSCDVIDFDANDTTFDELLTECSQISLGMFDKVIIYNNSLFLTAAKTKKNPYDKKDFEEMIKYLNNENPSTCLIFGCVYNKKLDSRSKIVKCVQNKGKIIECKNLEANDWPLFVRRYFEKRNVSIDEDAVKEIVKRCDGDLSIFNNEVNKLVLYKTNNVKYEDVDKIVTKPLSSNVFDILSCVLYGKKNEAIKIYRDLRLSKVEPVNLISIMTYSLIFLDKVLYLNNKGFSNVQVASTLSCSPYQVFINLHQFGRINRNNIKLLLDKLFYLDKSIKHSSVDRFFAFEKFIIEY